MTRILKAMTIPLLTALLLIALAACSGSVDEAAFGEMGVAREAGAPATAAAMATAAPMLASHESEQSFGKEAVAEKIVEVELEAAPAPAAASATEAATAMGDASTAEFDIARVQAALVQQKRIIVRTVDMGVVVADVEESLESVGGIAEDLGGWVVSAERFSRHSGRVSMRVPAQDLDTAIGMVRDHAIEVERESSTSDDVSEEYYDSQSRLKSLSLTEEYMLGLFDRAERVEDALDVQRELRHIQSEIEVLKGRIRFLEETAAFSLLRVDLTLAPVDMPVDAGEDRIVIVGESADFSATFEPPDGFEEFAYEWDFGDHLGTVSGTGSAPTTTPGVRITATTSRSFVVDRPHIVQLKVTAYGDGIAEGKTSFVEDVKEIPALEVFMGEGRSAGERSSAWGVAGEPVELRGSFSRSRELSGYRYELDFGDGTPVEKGSVEEGASRVTFTHVYEEDRPWAYTAELRVFADSEAGDVEGVAYSEVYIEEAQGFIVGGWNAGEDAKTATRTLSEVARGGMTTIIWLVIFSPLLAGVIAIFYGIIRLESRIRRNRRARAQSAESTADAD